MKVLLAQGTPYAPALSGAAKANRLVCEALVARGHACRAVAPAPDVEGLSSQPGFAGYVAELGGHPDADSRGVDVRPVRSGSELRAALRFHVEDFAPDWTFVSSEDPGQILLEAALRAHPGRVVYFARTPQLLPFGPGAMLPGERGAGLLREVAGLVAVSQFVAGLLRRHGGLEAAVLPLPAYGAPPFPRLGDPAAPYVTMFNPCADKGLAILLGMAVARPDVAFAAVPMWGTTAADREQMDRLPNLTLLRPEREVDRIFARTRVLLVPSLWAEGKARSILEALLRGIPVLASDVGGNAEAMLGLDHLLPARPIERYVPQFAGGLPEPVVPGQDVGPWLAALDDLQDEARYRRLSEESRRRALDHVGQQDIGCLVDYLAGLERAPTRPVAPGPAEPRTAGLSADRAALLALRLARRSTAARDVIPRRREDQPRVPSLAQERIWLAEQAGPPTGCYNLPGAFRLRGPLDREALRHALSEVQRRHAVLRSRFAGDGAGRPLLLVDPPAEVELPETELGEGPARLESLMRDEAARPFDVGRGPLQRARLVRCGPQEHVLVLTGHHSVSDGWSSRLRFRELAELYAAARAGRPPSLPELPLQYEDYAAWQRERLRGDLLTRLVQGWRDRLEGAPAGIALPSDRERAGPTSGRGGRVAIAVPAAVSRALLELSRQRGATPFMTLLAAFSVFLHRLSGQDDLVVGSPVAGRLRPELEGLLGLFVNTLPLRCDLTGGPTFCSLLERVREMVVSSLAAQELPFPLLGDALREAGRAVPALRVSFALENTPPRPLVLDGLEVQEIPIETGWVQNDLGLALAEGPDGLRGGLDYSADLFDRESAERLAGHFLTLLDGIVARPDDPIAGLPLLTPAQRRQVLVDWNGPRVEGADVLLHQLVEKQAARTPRATAVEHAGRRLSYAELERRANRLARLLGRRLGPGARVGVGLFPSADRVVALLAILKAGAAFVPLEPAQPWARRARIAQDAALDLMIGAEAPPGVELLRLETLRDALAQESDTPPLPRSAPGDPAYVLYTSGSTGRPKGVLGTHRGAVNRIAWMARLCPFEPGEVASQRTSLGFVDAVAEIFGPLAAGVPLVVLDSEDSGDPVRLLEALARHRVSRLVLVPPLLRALLDSQGAGARLRRLRVCVSSGEALPAALAARFRDLVPGVRLLNLYGSTEVAGDVTWAEVDATPASVPIGRPIDNMRAYVLDRGLQPVPVGVEGELYAAGSGLAAGYWADPELTAARFVPDPFAGGSMYRMGDLARWRADGVLEYRGRCDLQLKVRGQRVEPAEIEAALLEHPGVSRAAVALRGGRLVAYVVSEALPGEAELRTFLRARLPEAMVPALVEPLPALPLTSSGKLDRAALPEPRPRQVEGGPLRPCDELERQVAAAFEQVLGRGVGHADGFFDAGGDSLLAARLVALLGERTGRRLYASDLVAAPTVEALAAKLRAPAAPVSELLPLGGPVGGPVLLCVHGIDGDVVSYRRLSVLLGGSLRLIGLRPGPGSGAVVLAELAAQHAARILTHDPEGPYRLVGESFGGTLALEIAGLLRSQGREVELVVLLDTWGPGYPRFETGPRVLAHLRALLERPGQAPSYLATRLSALRLVVVRMLSRRARRVLRRFGGVPGALANPGGVRYLEALYGHRPQPYAGPVLLLRAECQPVGCRPDPCSGWGPLLGDLEVGSVPGGHGALQVPPAVERVAQLISLRLAQGRLRRPALLEPGGARHLPEGLGQPA